MQTPLPLNIVGRRTARTRGNSNSNSNWNVPGDVWVSISKVPRRVLGVPSHMAERKSGAALQCRAHTLCQKSVHHHFWVLFGPFHHLPFSHQVMTMTFGNGYRLDA